VGYSNVIGSQGSGGGAFEMVAVNDIVLGPNASFDTSGGHGGYSSHRSGGGGSGGSLVIVAGGSIVVHAGAHFASRGGDAGGDGAGGGGGGRIRLAAESLDMEDDTVTFDVSGGNGGGAESGTIQRLRRVPLSYRVDVNRGVFGTSRSLRLRGGSEFKTTSTGSRKHSLGVLSGTFSLYFFFFFFSSTLFIFINTHTQTHTHTHTGPRYGLYYPSRPSRVSYFVRFGNNKVDGQLEDVSGGLFALHDENFKNTDETVIGVGVVNGRFRHGSNVRYAMNLQSHTHHHLNHVSQDHANHSRISSETESDHTNHHNHHHRSFSENLPHTDRVLRGRWYKIDIRMNWRDMTYNIHIDDELKIFDAPFRSSRLFSIGLYNHDSMDVWFDEIYVGHDDSMNFVCPQTRSLGRVFMKRPTQTEWDEQTEFQDETWNITRHESHVSRRSLYTDENLNGVSLLLFFFVLFFSESQLTDLQLNTLISTQHTHTHRRTHTGRRRTTPSIPCRYQSTTKSNTKRRVSSWCTHVSSSRT